MTQTLAIPTQIDEETEKIVRECEALAMNYRDFTISTQQHYDEAVDIGKGVALKLKKVQLLDEEIAGPAKTLYQTLHGRFTPVIAGLKTVKEMLSKKSGDYQDQCRRKQEEEQRRLDAERAKKEADLRAKAEAAKAAGNETKADKLEAKADVVATSAQIAAPVMQKQPGAAGRTYYFARVVDPAAVPREYCKPDESALKELSEETKGEAKVPGVVFYKETRTAFGGK